MLISTVSSTHQHAENVQTTAPPPRRDRLNPHSDRRLSVNPSPHQANPHPDRRRDHQPKPRRAHPSPNQRLSVNSSHVVFYPSYFFLSCYGEQRENGEQRERTEKRGRAEEKKLKREKILGKMKEKGKKRKKKKSLNRLVNRRVGNSFLMDEECTIAVHL
jgi:hypothetical protein